MDRAEFGPEMDRMKSTWGDKPFPEPRVTLFFNYARSFDADQFGRAVSHLIANNRYAPLLDDLKTALSSSHKEKNWAKDRRFEEEMEGRDCPWCFTTGVVFGTHKIEHSITVFQCPCAFGTHYDKFPGKEKWSKALELEYTRDG